MKLGSQRRDPKTCQRGMIFRFVGQYAYCRTAEGRVFRLAPGRRTVKPHVSRPCQITIRGLGTVLAGVTIADRVARVTSPDPIWHGCEITRNDAIITILP